MQWNFIICFIWPQDNVKEILYTYVYVFSVNYFTLFLFRLSIFYDVNVWKMFISIIMITGILFKVFLRVKWKIMLFIEPTEINHLWISKKKEYNFKYTLYPRSRTKCIKKTEIDFMQAFPKVHLSQTFFLLYANYRCTWA